MRGRKEALLEELAIAGRAYVDHWGWWCLVFWIGFVATHVAVVVRAWWVWR